MISDSRQIRKANNEHCWLNFDNYFPIIHFICLRSCQSSRRWIFLFIPQLIALQLNSVKRKSRKCYREINFGAAKTRRTLAETNSYAFVNICWKLIACQQQIFLVSGMIFSLPFLVITFCVYGFIPELRNLHGKSLMCYVFGLTVLYISLSMVQLEGKTFMSESVPCIASGYVIYISVLLCFFWLNVMCFDIWSTFK